MMVNWDTTYLNNQSQYCEGENQLFMEVVDQEYFNIDNIVI